MNVQSSFCKKRKWRLHLYVDLKDVVKPIISVRYPLPMAEELTSHFYSLQPCAKATYRYSWYPKEETSQPLLLMWAALVTMLLCTQLVPKNDEAHVGWHPRGIHLLR